MKYHDRVYGECNIDEPLVLDLMNSHSLQRLLWIDQGGYRPLWAKPGIDIGEFDHSRFAHSVGVFLLLRMYGASLEEQIAGLIHDVSHSAFSHCIDYVLEGGSEQEHSHQDNLFETYIYRSEIPEILQKYGLDVTHIIDDSHFPLKEKNLPDLCADRIDYSLRTAVLFHEKEPREIRSLLGDLSALEGRWVFNNFSSAQQYAYLFSTLNQQYYAGLSSAVMFRAVGDCLQYALRCGYIVEADLYTTDPEVLLKIQSKILQDSHLRFLWDCMNNKYSVSTDVTKANKRVFCKSRVVDPLWMDLDGIKRVSEEDSEWSKLLCLEMKPKEYFFSFGSTSFS
jgi:HD superfamily phosphohydrolase